MQAKRFFALFIVLLMALSIVVFFYHLDRTSRESGVREFYVGVTFSSNTTAEARLLIDRVKNYTNLLIVQSGPVSKNEPILNEICDYAANAGLNIIVYFGSLDRPWQPTWIDTARQRWGNQFLGVYFFDEPAGIILDYEFPSGGPLDPYYEAFLLNSPKNYEGMADFFVNGWQAMPEMHTIKSGPIPPVTFTSDYVLYWFDYLAGYDVMLAQFGWNHSRVQDIALVRGAANVQNKSWGVIITWTFDDPPYLEGGNELYQDMLMAYENGAEYIAVFNYPKINDYGILKQEHFEALERFWHEIQTNSHCNPNSAHTVLVLPKNYGWGMRNPNDTIWGLWGADENSLQIWNVSRTLLTRYAPYIDIVYEDARFSLKDKYSKIYYWNSTL
ncbi:MAG: hypothetical protein JSV75_00295 [Candidatus Bathyarchaeota archaeon]|nr:MAG: hypothetical protein JSV75_00295 [Candidatus Bathyarchaeota archaeon]